MHGPVPHAEYIKTNEHEECNPSPFMWSTSTKLTTAFYARTYFLRNIPRIMRGNAKKLPGYSIYVCRTVGSGYGVQHMETEVLIPEAYPRRIREYSCIAGWGFSAKCLNKQPRILHPCPFMHPKSEQRRNFVRGWRRSSTSLKKIYPPFSSRCWRRNKKVRRWVYLLNKYMRRSIY